MKRLVLIVVSMFALAIITSGCVVRHHPRAVVHVPAPRAAVVVEAPAPRVRVRVRPRPRPRVCYERRCRRVCNVWGCFDRCRRVSYRCY